MNKSEIAERAQQEIRHIIICDDCKTRGIPGTKKFNWPLCDWCIREVDKIQPVIEYVCKFVERAIAESQAPQWISVEERLPDTTDSYLVWVRGIGDDGEMFQESVEAVFSRDIKHWTVQHGWHSREVQGWMPMPAPPSKGN